VGSDHRYGMGQNRGPTGTSWDDNAKCTCACHPAVRYDGTPDQWIDGVQSICFVRLCCCWSTGWSRDKTDLTGANVDKGLVLPQFLVVEIRVVQRAGRGRIAPNSEGNQARRGRIRSVWGVGTFGSPNLTWWTCRPSTISEPDKRETEI
jgi:hypothetical protein